MSLPSLPTVTPTLTVAGAYSAGDFVGTSASSMEFTKVGPHISVDGKGCAGYIVGARLIDYAAQSKAAELWVFESAVTPPNDNAAWSISDADSKKLLCVIPFETYYASALNSVSEGVPAGGAARYVCAANSTSLYGCLVTRGTPTYATGDVTVRLTIVPD